MKEYTCKRNKLKKRRSSSIESAGQSRDWSIFKAYLRGGGSCGKSACWSQALMMFTKSFGVSAFLAFCATNWANRPNAWSTSSWLCPVRRHEIVASRSTPQRFIWRCTLHFQRNSGNAVPLPGQNPTYHKTLLNSWQVSLAHKRCEEWKHYVVLTFSACVIALQSQCQLWQYDTFRRQLC